MRDIYAARRQEIFALMQNNSVMLLPANAKQLRNGDAEYPFRQDSNFYYVSGFTEDDAVLVLLKTDKANQFIIFCKETTELEARWQGARLGTKGALAKLGADTAYVQADFDHKMPEILLNLESVYYPIGQNCVFEQQLRGCLSQMSHSAREGKAAPHQHVDARVILHELRLIKKSDEIALMRKAAQISAKAHARAMTVCKAAMHEYELEAEYLHEFTRGGARSPAYTSIVGAGANACVLHYVDNQDILKDGDLVLVDAGAEYQSYAADITRVFPVNGRFSEPQRIIYDLVLKAQLAGIELARVGQAWNAIQDVIVDILGEGLVGLGIIKNKQDYKKYYMHNSGHWLGLDVHDAGDYKIKGEWRVLQSGMVLTVEPGLYFPPDAKEIDEKWRGIGVRIEDDVLVTDGDPDVLSKDAPKTVQAIEALMQRA